MGGDDTFCCADMKAGVKSRRETESCPLTTLIVSMTGQNRTLLLHAHAQEGVTLQHPFILA